MLREVVPHHSRFLLVFLNHDQTLSDNRNF
jgi:hypothetical protein